MTGFQINEAAVKELFAQDALIELVMEKAETIAEVIRSLAPGDHYPDTIEVIAASADDLDGDVAGAVIRTEDPLGHLIEFGTGERHTTEGASRGEMPVFAPFRRGAEASGSYDG